MRNPLPSKNARIVRFHKIGPPEVLQLDELPLPAPDNSEVRLRVKAIGLNRAEVHFRQGRYRFSPVLPSKIGYEASGIVEAVGRNVNGSWLGRTVSTLPAFPANKYGVYGEVAIVPVTAIAEYPAHLYFRRGYIDLDAVSNRVRRADSRRQVLRDDFVLIFALITAASSSVGIAAIEIAKAEGAISIATTRSRKKKAQLLELGAIM